jgi:hypothetical protein
MDDRQQQIRERAGLEESRLNQDFIDWLQKYGFALLLVVLVAAGSVILFRKWEEKKAGRLDEAFTEFENARTNGIVSPDAMKTVALEYGDVRSIGLLAKMDEADAYLQAVARRVKPGAQVKDDGTVENPEDLVTDADRSSYLSIAAERYQQVVEGTKGDASKALMNIGARFGLAAVAESNGKWDEAKQIYGDIATVADATGYKQHGAIAKSRAEKIGMLASVAPLPKKSDVPMPPAPPETPATGAALPMSDGNVVTAPATGSITTPSGATVQAVDPNAVPAAIREQMEKRAREREEELKKKEAEAKEGEKKPEEAKPAEPAPAPAPAPTPAPK